MVLCQHVGWKTTFCIIFMPFSNVSWLSYINTRLSSSVSAASLKSFSFLISVTFLPQYRWSPLTTCTHTFSQAQKQLQLESAWLKPFLSPLLPELHYSSPLRTRELNKRHLETCCMLFPTNIQSYMCIVCMFTAQGLVGKTSALGWGTKKHVFKSLLLSLTRYSQACYHLLALVFSSIKWEES